jgi:hypothetical protein
MLPRRIFIIVSSVFFFISTITFLNSAQTLTGFTIIEQTSPKNNLLVGVWFLIAAISMFCVETVQREKESDLERKLEKVPPGKGIKGAYIPLTKVIKERTTNSNKVVIEVRDNSIYRDGRPVQGLTIDRGYVEFVGVHYTSSGAADIISEDEALRVKNEADPYVYLLEPLDYSVSSPMEIRHMIGSAAAEEAIKVKVRYPIDRVFLKFEKNRPTHFAIDGDIERAHLVKRKGRYVAREKVKSNESE